MPSFNFAIARGWDVASPTNVENIIATPPHVLPDQLAPELGPVKIRALSGRARRDGAKQVVWAWDVLLRSELDTFIQTIWLDYITASTKVTILTRGADNKYAGFNAYADVPLAGEDYTIVAGGLNIRDLRVTFFDVTGTGSFDRSFDLSFQI